MDWASGRQVASGETASARRRALPPPVGTAQRACSDWGDKWLRSNNLEPSGDRSPRDGAAISLGTGRGWISPLETEIWVRAARPFSMTEAKMRTPSEAVAGRLSIAGAPGEIRPEWVIWLIWNDC